MKIKRFFKTLDEQMKWHTWFAWHPCVIEDKIYWLETVEARRVRYGWKYRLPGDKTTT